MLTLIAFSAALMQQTPAPAAPPQVHTRVMVMGADGPGGLDKDGDGQISREEFAAPMNDHFARMDTNGDGRLSTEELTAGHGAMGAGGEHDIRIMRGPGGADGPGVRHFEMRRDHAGGADGAHAGHGAGGDHEVRIMRGPHGGAGEGRTMVFTRGEPGAGAEREVVIIGGPGGHDPMRPGAHAEGAAGHDIEIRRMGGPGGQNDLDADNDGRISEAEFTAPLREAFARMDADRSGFIEAGERSSGRREVFVHRIEVGADRED
jgi:hypothetical protein